MPNESTYHEPVLLTEVLSFLGQARRVFDGTLGGGGHTAALLERGTSVVAVDRDPAARAAAAGRLGRFVESGELQIIDSTFADAAMNRDIAEPFDGVLLDLGVSSHQIDDDSRGFTFREGALLDMRMTAGEGASGRVNGGERASTAAEWLNETDVREIERVFKEYGDEPRARRLAHAVVSRRQRHPFAISDDLVGAIRAALGPRSGAPDFARLFQAVRIAVNDELGELARALPALCDRLTPDGVLVVIAYHSGEDRLVKRVFQEWSRACVCPPRQPMCTCGGVARGVTLTKKPVEATEGELERNPRARSAKLRAWRKGPPGLRPQASGPSV